MSIARNVSEHDATDVPESTALVPLTISDNNGDRPQTETQQQQQQQQQQQIQLTNRVNGLFQKMWIIEILSLMLSIAATGVTAGLLHQWNDRPLSDWHHSITFNTVVSFLALISHSALAFVISSCLGQLKWMWFAPTRRPRRLIDFETFDGASRGPIGAAAFLLNSHRPGLGILAAILTILLLVFEPFIQQTISTTSRSAASLALGDDSDDNVTVPIVHSYSVNGFQTKDIFIGVVSPQMKAAIYDGLFYSNISDTGVSIQPTCPTGNCTWTTFSNMGVCSQCVDVTSLLEAACADISYPDNTFVGVEGLSTPQFCGYKLPNGLNNTSNITSTSSLPLLDTSAGTLNSNALSHISPVLANVSAIIWAGSSFQPNTTAVDCILHLCGQVVTDAHVSNGIFFESINSTINNVTSIGDNTTGNITVIAPVSESGSSSGKDGVTLVMDAISHEAIGSYLSKSLSGSVQANIEDSSSNYPIDTREISASSDFLDGIVNLETTSSSGTGNGDLAISMINVTHSLQNLAQSMSNYLRLVGGLDAPGTSYENITYYKTQWKWLIFHFGLELLAVFAFITTVTLNRFRYRLPVWKNYSLVGISHNLSVHGGIFDDKKNEGGREQPTATATLAMMKEVQEINQFAKTNYVSLREGKDGILVLRR
ncbi:hypothetical protein N7540_006544 [Penicillium herquei]|nr:hypothetical protein N7540_006544 [Penicillium herquei]